MNFVNDKKMEIFTPSMDGYGGISGENIGSSSVNYNDILYNDHLGYENSPKGLKEWENDYRKDPNTFDWNYQNTLEVQKFNKDGFYSNIPSENINIEGGIPESLKNALRNNSCDNEQLSSCIVPSFSGITAPSANSLNQGLGKVDIKTGNQVKNVYLNPRLLNKVDPIARRSVETVSGTVYI